MRLHGWDSYHVNKTTFCLYQSNMLISDGTYYQSWGKKSRVIQCGTQWTQRMLKHASPSSLSLLCIYHIKKKLPFWHSIVEATDEWTNLIDEYMQLIAKVAWESAVILTGNEEMQCWKRIHAMRTDTWRSLPQNVLQVPHSLNYHRKESLAVVVTK